VSERLPTAAFARLVLQVVAVAGVYYLAARLGLLLQLPGTNASPVWPPSGIALAAMLLFGRRLWPGVLIGAFLANLLTLPSSLGGLTAAAVIALGNTLEALIAASLILRLTGARNPFESVPHVFRFVLAAAAACAVASSIGAASLTLTGIIPAVIAGNVWFTWWLGDTAGLLILAPALVGWGRQWRWGLGGERLAEFVVLLVCAVALTELLFGGWIASELIRSLPYILLAALLWAAFRFGPRETASVAVVLSVVTTAQTWLSMRHAHDAGARLAPFVSPAVSANDSLLMLQLFVCAIALTGLLLAAAVNERRRMERDMRELNRSLETRVAERTTALEAALAEQTVLLQEVHHRVKNNLQVISSLLDLQGNSSDDVVIQRTLADAQGRVRSMALLHQMLYEQKNFSRVRLDDYLRQLTEHALASARAAHVTVEFDLDPVGLDLQRAVPCALLVNELLTNVCKHAFPEQRPGTLTLQLRAPGSDGLARLSVCDDGVGLPGDVAPGETRTLGLQIVPLLAEQMRAQLHITAEPGACFELRFALDSTPDNP
jgi:two-component sensor histidine kinase/integral membrane sensor domain MASE1